MRGQRATITAIRKGERDFAALHGCVWFHAASVGEFEQARPLIERLKREKPQRKIVVTFFSPSGYEMRKSYSLADGVFYLPFATRRNARIFVSALKPSAAIFVKYEYWKAYMSELKMQDIPIYIIDAIYRPEQLFFRWWGKWYLNYLKYFTTLFVQDARSKQLLEQHNITNVVVAGDTRFDRVLEICKNPKTIEPVTWFINADSAQKVIVAGSTWMPDEKLLYRYMCTHENVKLVLVPHELTTEHLNGIFNLFEGRFMRYSEATEQNMHFCRVLLIDTVGLLSSLYRYAAVGYVGGGFGDGIHNTIEAATFGIPVLFGPNHNKFREAKQMLDCGAAYTFRSYEQFEKAMDNALQHSEEYGKKLKMAG